MIFLHLSFYPAHVHWNLIEYYLQIVQTNLDIIIKIVYLNFKIQLIQIKIFNAEQITTDVSDIALAFNFGT